MKIYKANIRGEGFYDERYTTAANIYIALDQIEKVLRDDFYEPEYLEIEIEEMR